MENRTCQECRHFVQHYAVVGGQLFEVGCGLCVRARGKHKKPGDRACEGFAEAVTRKVLNTELTVES